ncbi:hypothetical protein SELMODRAFT_233415 [Selaginella moellendorffii]|uniref:Uncharacterized protein n=1 Tax=Selaginella moellendorffii TaxID=88036 RepID=D8S8T4_SELML|nr:ATP synthase subunit d, mitochondrial [Selaginella moellendorffii]EFJ19223.1 hypothetical protein SELMODRAFT_233415 [Selaginella moellendorffii]|eukprot:XP_002979821.1 ATP synthase subunit d, mitochondrial [Selaginella moellendorffii]
MALVGAFRASRALRALAGRSAAGGLDWKEMDHWIDYWSFSPDVKTELLKLKHHITETAHRMDALFIKEKHVIDWDAHRKVLPAEVVDLYQKTYESIEVPKYVDEDREEAVKMFAELEQKAIKADEEFAAARAKLEEEEEKIRKFKERLPTITVDEVLAEHPDIKEKIDAEIRSLNWDYAPLGSKEIAK